MGDAPAWEMGWTNNTHRKKKIWCIDCLVERVRWVRHVAHTGAIRIVFRFFVGKSERKNLLHVWAEVREILKLILINVCEVWTAFS